MDGDDYWTDPRKLQKQVDFLDNHPEFSIVGHWVENVDASGKVLEEKQPYTGRRCPEEFGFKNAVMGTPLHPCSWLIRNIWPDIEKHHKTLVSLPSLDDPLALLVLKAGKGFCLSETMGVYRIHSRGMWTSRSEVTKRYGSLAYSCSIPRLIGDHHAGLTAQSIERTQAELVELLACWKVVSRTLELLKLSRESDLVPKRRIAAVCLKVVIALSKKLWSRAWSRCGARTKCE